MTEPIHILLVDDNPLVLSSFRHYFNSTDDIVVVAEASNGEEALAYDPNPDDSQRQQVARAVASCPVQAIIAEMDPPSDRTTK